jgi:protein gp37
MNKTDISWCTHTWNPITGCKRGCYYCYARKVHNRFNKTPFDQIVEHPERYNDKDLASKKPKVIFVGSMSDCVYWSSEQFNKIVDVARSHAQHTYMFLSKSAWAYAGIKFPENCMQGLTVEGFNPEEIPRYLYDTVNDFAENNPRPFLSIEPLLYPLSPYVDYDKFELVVVGMQTGPGAKDVDIKTRKSLDLLRPEFCYRPVKTHWKPSMYKWLLGKFDNYVLSENGFKKVVTVK